MSFPFGSGMPYPNNSSPYPPQHQQQQQHHQSPYPTAGGGGAYPQQMPSSNPGYPTSTPGYPSATPGYPTATPGYPTATPGYPSATPGYPTSTPGYPTSTPGYPTSTPGYPTSTAGYPTSAHDYANNNTPYPPSQPQPNIPFGAGFGMPQLPKKPSRHQSYYPTQPPTSSYPHQSSSSPSSNMPSSVNSSPYPTNPNSYTQGYSSTSHQSNSGYSAVATNMANCFSEMQIHIKDTRKENRSKGTPTVFAAPNFDPVADAKALRKAMKGFGTDENALINIICRRSNEQRQIIQREYKTNFGKDLLEDIKSETSGNFENLLVALLTPIINYYVKELHDAMAGIGTDEDVLIEVLCSMSNYEIHTIKNAYERLYGKNLESELMSETSGNFKRLLVALCAAGRDESGTTNLEIARRDATELLNAGELRVGTDESTFNMILCQRNYAQIKLVCEEYERITGHSLEKAIKKEFSGDIMDGLIAIIQCTSNKSAFFASRLHKSMAGIGTNDNQLIRLIVTRCEIDLEDIKTVYEKLYGKSLRSWIKGDTSGHYKHALYALIGEQRSS